eukprot:c29645_g1_i1 orf=31-264(-)
MVGNHQYKYEDPQEICEETQILIINHLEVKHPRRSAAHLCSCNAPNAIVLSPNSVDVCEECNLNPAWYLDTSGPLVP